MAGGEFIPLVFALLCDKSEHSYKLVFQKLRENQSFNAKHIIIDFDKKIMNAAKEFFPKIEFRGCHLNYTKQIWKSIQSANLSEFHNNDADIAAKLRMLGALALVPCNEVDARFEELEQMEFFSENKQ